MVAHHGELRHTMVYGNTGDAIVERVQVPNPPDMQIERLPFVANAPRVRNIMSNDLVCAYDDLELSALTALMVRHHIGCVPVVDRMGRAIGMVTKTDVVDHVDSALRAPVRRDRPPVVRARDIMMPLPLTLPDSATLAQAANLMILEDIHHVMIVSDGGFLVGVVSAKDLVHWMVESDAL